MSEPVEGAYLLAAHDEEDLPLMERATCLRCARTCYLGPRQSEFRRSKRCVVYCFTCTALTYAQLPAPVYSLGNPLS
jgi:hypothetical protein